MRGTQRNLTPNSLIRDSHSIPPKVSTTHDVSHCATTPIRGLLPQRPPVPDLGSCLIPGTWWVTGAATTFRSHSTSPAAVQGPWQTLSSPGHLAPCDVAWHPLQRGWGTSHTCRVHHPPTVQSTLLPSDTRLLLREASQQKASVHG